MADGYDRFDNEGGGGGSFVMGLLTGTVLGAGLGMLFAPKAGSELRGQISEQAGTLANTASEHYRPASAGAAAVFVVITRPPLRRLAGAALRTWLGASVPLFLARQARQAWMESGRAA